jgi:TPR repeat protein
MYSWGIGVEQDDYESLRWYKKAAAQGSAEGNAQVGYHYEQIEDDPTEAAKWYRIAADQEHAEAQYWLGLLYEAGFGVEMDVLEALRLYRRAAEKGNVYAQWQLGFSYARGLGGDPNYEEAYYWLYIAEENGMGEGFSDFGTDDVAEHLTPEQINRMEARAGRWLEAVEE